MSICGSSSTLTTTLSYPVLSAPGDLSQIMTSQSLEFRQTSYLASQGHKTVRVTTLNPLSVSSKYHYTQANFSCIVRSFCVLRQNFKLGVLPPWSGSSAYGNPLHLLYTGSVGKMSHTYLFFISSPALCPAPPRPMMDRSHCSHEPRGKGPVEQDQSFFIIGLLLHPPLLRHKQKLEAAYRRVLIRDLPLWTPSAV
ncbi:hypothetical protein F5Y16DRAFT_382612 [Xylariaceae sp. FL0255]|nr:hypothetical protein F5Y16DRAFT_382612 [Xylariaceae sp. FL0255]